MNWLALFQNAYHSKKTFSTDEVSARVYICMYMCTCVCVYIYYVFVYMYIYVCVYVCI